MRNTFLFKTLLFAAVACCMFLPACDDDSGGGGGRSGVALFTNDTYVDYVVDPGDLAGSEAYNLEKTIKGYGIAVHTFTGITAGDFSASASGSRLALVIPELENGDLDAAIDNTARTAINDFVGAGGNLIVFANEYMDVLLNNIFTWSIISGEYSGTLNLNVTDAANTPFAGGIAILEYNDGTEVIDDATLPAGSKAIYTDSVSGDAGFVVIPFENGYVIIVGWDWFDAKPVGAYDEGWLEVLEKAIKL